MKNLAPILRFIGSTILTTAIVGGVAGLFGWVAVLDGNKLPLLDVTGAVIIAAIGALFYLIGWFLGGKNETAQNTESIKFDPKNLDFIYVAFKRTRNISLWLFIFMMLTGVFVFLLFLPDLIDTDAPITYKILGVGLSLLFLGVGLVFYINYSKFRNIKSSIPYLTIINHPESIDQVEVSYFQKAGAPGKMGQQINAKLITGSGKLAVLMISEQNLELLLQYLQTYNKDIRVERKHQQI